MDLINRKEDAEYWFLLEEVQLYTPCRSSSRSYKSFISYEDCSNQPINDASVTADCCNMVLGWGEITHIHWFIRGSSSEPQPWVTQVAMKCAEFTRKSFPAMWSLLRNNYIGFKTEELAASVSLILLLCIFLSGLLERRIVNLFEAGEQ
jgi:hypothetical protein